VVTAAAVALLAGSGYVWYAMSHRVPDPPIQGNGGSGSPSTGVRPEASQKATQLPKEEPKAGVPPGPKPLPPQTVSPPVATNSGRAVRNDAKSKLDEAEQKAGPGGRGAVATAGAPATPTTTVGPATPPPIVPTQPTASPPGVSGSGVVLPPAPPPAERAPMLGVEQAVAVLNRLADLFVTFEVEKLKALYPDPTPRDKNFLARAKKEYQSCTLKFSAPKNLTPDGGDEVRLDAAAVLACKAKSGSPPPDQLVTNSFTLKRVENGWQVINWNSNIR